MSEIFINVMSNKILNSRETFLKDQRAFKGIDRPFELRGESRLIRSVITNWMLGKFFLSHFKGSSSQDQQKTLGCRLITSKVTLTGKSHFMLIFLTPQGHFTKLHQLRKVDGCALMYEIWRIFSSLMKNKKEKIRQMNCHCTVYTGTTWNDFAESQQLRTMNARGHINSVP